MSTEKTSLENENQTSCLGAVSGSTFTIDDMKKAFMAGADKKYWTKIHLTGVVSGQDYVLEPIFEKWFEYYRLNSNNFQNTDKDGK